MTTAATSARAGFDVDQAAAKLRAARATLDLILDEGLAPAAVDDLTGVAGLLEAALEDLGEPGS